MDIKDVMTANPHKVVPVDLALPRAAVTAEQETHSVPYSDAKAGEASRSTKPRSVVQERTQRRQDVINDVAQRTLDIIRF